MFILRQKIIGRLSSLKAPLLLRYSSTSSRIHRVLIANRGEIACRIIRTARKLGVETVAVYSDADRKSMHVQMADYAYCIGPPPSLQSYLLADKIIDVAKKSNSQAIHPGYGFLSEKPEFANLCEKSGVIFIGPPSTAIRDMGIKSTSKEIMERASVPVIPGYHGADQSDSNLKMQADRIGYPVMIKAVRGGGGKGMRVAQSADVFLEQLASARRESEKAFGDANMLLERFVVAPRHVEVQVFGDMHGNYVYLYERDCSLQRRHQKVIEEAPAPGLTPEMRKRIGETAVQAARAVNYVSAGTVEFIVDPRTFEFFFMEMNTRLQVEHPVTEAITGLDLVEWQLRVANGERLPLTQELLAPPQGHAFEARIYAEDPESNFMPGAGPLQYLSLPCATPGVRVETGVRSGDEVSVHYDPMIAKLVVHSSDRRSALELLYRALAQFNVVGLKTNISFLQRIATNEGFIAGAINTRFFEDHQQELLPPKKKVDLPSLDVLTKRRLFSAALSAFLIQSQHSSQFSAAKRDVQSPFLDTEFNSFRMNHLHIKRQRVKFNETELDLLVECSPKNEFRVQLVSVPPKSSGSRPTGAPTEPDPSNWLSLHAELEPLPSPAERGTATPTLPGYRLELSGALLSTGSSEETRYTQTVVLDGETLHVFDMDGHIEVELPGLSPDEETTGAGGASGEAGAGGSATARSPMPGVVDKVFVKPGDTVAAGQPLLVIIAMKMEYTIRANAAGVVASVRCKETQAVPRGALLVDFK